MLSCCVRFAPSWHPILVDNMLLRDDHRHIVMIRFPNWKEALLYFWYKKSSLQLENSHLLLLVTKSVLK